MRALLGPAVVGAILLAVLSTAADYVWFPGVPRDPVLSTAIRGSVIFAAFGAYLGWRKGQTLLGIAGGLASGLIAALSFSALAPIVGDAGMPASSLLLWILLSILQTHLDGRVNVAKGVARGVIATIFYVLGFSLVRFQLYRVSSPVTFPFFSDFAAWAIAYLPGLFVLFRR